MVSLSPRLLCVCITALSLAWPGSVAAAGLSVERTRVFGPGVQSSTTPLPVNYFYVQAVDDGGNNFTAVDERTFELSFASSPQQFRRRVEVLNLGGGLLLYQYRTHSDLTHLSLSLTHNGRHLRGSPFTIGALLHENCACPLKPLRQWLEDYQCSPEGDLPQITADLEPFTQQGGVDIEKLYERAAEMFPRVSFIHYSIVGNKLYAQKFGSITGFKFLSDMILLSIVNKVWLPDMELIVNLGDWPLNKVRSHAPFPVFSWCGSHETRDIVWPTWDLMKSTIMGLDRVSLSILTAQKTLGLPWGEREPRALFRGRDSNQARLDLVATHRNNTELFDVGITNWFFFEHKEEVYGPNADRLGFHDFFKYKYQLNIDGTVAAYRLPYLLAGGSLVLKQDSDYYEHFYPRLEPWVHYVPVERGLGDVEERLRWARANDGRAREMAANAFQFVQDHLQPHHLYCYIMQLLERYASLQRGKPRIHSGMELVEPELPHDCHETCNEIQRDIHKKDEL